MELYKAASVGLRKRCCNIGNWEQYTETNPSGWLWDTYYIVV